MDCSLRDSAPVPADLGRAERLWRDSLMDDSSRACGKEGRRVDRSWSAREAELSAKRESGERDS